MRFPDVAREWDRERNAPATPHDVTAGSRRVVWWRCSRDPAHRWEARVMLRTRTLAGRPAGTGCPSCAVDRPARRPRPVLAEARPDLAAQWDPERNGSLCPEAVTLGSKRRVWWRCRENHAHVWEAEVGARVRFGTGCPFCSGLRTTAAESLAATHPGLTAEWDVGRNGERRPEELRAGSNLRVWWRCPAGHSWRTSPAMRALRGTGCPTCAGVGRRAQSPSG
jgi:hypothetical protein